MGAKITVIPASRNQFTSIPVNAPSKRRVAGYARVSTDLEEQQSSYESQLRYYTNYIQSNASWEFVGMYSDEGISGTSTAGRAGFNRMIEDALDGKIDLIITKSVSRFARNTVDSLTIIRKLKEKGIEVYFEKENIYTLDSKGELLITIMSSLAQEESRSISENTTWGRRKRFAEGKGGGVGFAHFLGYDKGPNGEYVINEEQAKTVRLIYDMFLSGMSFNSIARELTRREIPTPCGKTKWPASSVRSILKNEKYKGDALLQKQYTVDFLTHKRAVNNGEVPQYYVEGHHDPIIPPEVFDLVQEELEKLENIPGTYINIYTGKIRCASCGGYYGSKIWHSTNKCRKTVFVCNNRYKDGIRCRSPRVDFEELEKAFVEATNAIVDYKAEIIENIQLVIQTLGNTAGMERQKEQLESALTEIEEKANHLVSDNRHTSIDQSYYNQTYDELHSRYEETKAKYEEVEQAITGAPRKKARLQQFLKDLEEQEVVTGFDETIWRTLVDYVTVYSREDLRVTFKDGTEVQI